MPHPSMQGHGRPRDSRLARVDVTKALGVTKEPAEAKSLTAMTNKVERNPLVGRFGPNLWIAMVQGAPAPLVAYHPRELAHKTATTVRKTNLQTPAPQVGTWAECAMAARAGRVAYRTGRVSPRTLQIRSRLMLYPSSILPVSPQSSRVCESLYRDRGVASRAAEQAVLLLYRADPYKVKAANGAGGSLQMVGSSRLGCHKARIAAEKFFLITHPLVHVLLVTMVDARRSCPAARGTQISSSDETRAYDQSRGRRSLRMGD